MRWSAAGASDVGRVRKNNEDAFRVDEALGLLIVADGMGGHAAGEVASALAVDVVQERMRGRGTESLEPRPLHWSPEAKRLVAAVEEANKIIHQAARTRADRHGMGTTLVAALRVGSRAVIAHVGDSRAYLLREGRLTPLTTDHSLVAEQVARGLISASQAETAENQNVLTRALGADATVEVDLQERRLRAGDTLMLCTDGLSRMASAEEMEKEVAGLSDPAQMCQNLVRLALEKGGRDNVTVAAARAVSEGIWRRIFCWGNGRRADAMTTR